MSDRGFLQRLQSLVYKSKPAEPSEPFLTRDTEPERMWAAWFYTQLLKPHLEWFARYGEERAKVLVFDPVDPCCLDVDSVTSLPNGGYETHRLCLIGKAGALVELLRRDELTLTLEHSPRRVNLDGEQKPARLVEFEQGYLATLNEELKPRDPKSLNTLIVYANWRLRP